MTPEDLRSNYSADTSTLTPVYNTWDTLEDLIVGKPTDQISKSRASKVSDGGLSTMVMERSFRVMAQLPTGQVKALTRRDKGKAMLMDIYMQRHVIPNANWGMDFLTKLRQWDFYSQVYGAMPMLYDWRVRDGYVGPDCRLIPIRDFTPQRGRNSIEDSDYVSIDTYHSVRELQKELDNKDSQWDKKELQDVISKAKEGDVARDSTKKSAIEQARSTFAGGGKGDNATIRLVTSYYRDKWYTWAPDYEDRLVRTVDNKTNGNIPVILKQAFPLIDSVYGLGDFERGKSLQMAGDAVTNLYLDATKMSIFRPIIVNPAGVVPHTLKYAPGARWLETIPNSIRAFETNPQGLQTFQSTMTYLKGALNNLAGTTDTTFTAENTSDPTFGKTPAALDMQQQRESSRDNWDRFFMEQALEQLLSGFVCLIADKHKAPIDIHVFDAEIADIKAAGYDDVTDLMTEYDSGDTAKLSIPKNAFKVDSKTIPYKYYIDANSTKAQDDKQQFEAITTLFGLFSKIPNLDAVLQGQGSKFDVGATMKLLANTAGVQDVDKIITPLTPEDVQQQQAMQQAAALGQSQDAAGNGQQQQPVPPKPIVNYKDAPASVQAQMEAADGYQPATIQERMGQQQAEAAAKGQGAQGEPPVSLVHRHGHTFHDPKIAAVAEHLFPEQQPQQ